MAGIKVIKERIKSVKNSRKITRTMEMVAAAKSKRMSDRVNGFKPYGEKIGDIMSSLSGLKDQVDSPFFREVPNPKRVAVVVVTGDRGLCGGYNSNALKLARKTITAHTEKGCEVDVYMIGKKGISNFKFLGIEVKESFINFDDKVSYQMAEDVATKLMNEFSLANVDLVEIVSAVYYSSAKQVPEVTRLLPVGIQEEEGEKTPSKDDSSGQEETAYKANTIYEPAPAVILAKLVPLTVKIIFYRAVLEAITSEWLARRVAMKSATDNAGEILKTLTLKYNRARQASITQELSEIVAGADAIS